MVADTKADDTTRHETTLDLAEASEGDRIDPALIPSSPEIDAGEPLDRHRARDGDDRTYSVRLVAHGYTDAYQNVQVALVYDPEADLFARLGGHTKSGAMNQVERDYKIYDLGRELAVVDEWDVDIAEVSSDEGAAEYVAEWVEILFDNIRGGDRAGDEIREFDGKTFTLADYDGRRASVQYQLVDGEDAA